MSSRQGRELSFPNAGTSLGGICRKSTCWRSALSEVFRNLVQFYPAHSWKEEYLLFPLARKVLSVQDDERLLKEFTSVESDIFAYTHESYDQLATELEDRIVKASPKMRIAAGQRVA